MSHKNRVAVLGMSAAIGCAAVAFAGTTPSHVAAATTATRHALPSPLDYVILASLADASNLLSLTAYRAPAAGMAAAHEKAPSARPQQTGE